MKANELREAISNYNVIYTTAKEFLSSNINWSEDNIDPEEYMVVIAMFIGEIIVTFVKNAEYNAKVYNTDFSTTITGEDHDQFLSELERDSKIFGMHSINN